MRVLLISPLPKVDPACGDIVYTQTLLSHPPEGVEYVTYADAIRDGSLIEHGRRARLRREPVLTAAAKAINVMRGRKWLFWEPFRYFSVRPGVFDAIHVHVFSCGFRQRDCPVVISNAASLRLLYRDARGWSPARVGVVERVERGLAACMGVDHTSYRVPGAERVIAFTDKLREWYVTQGIAEASRVDVVPIYLPMGPAMGSVGAGRVPSRVGFIAKDFEAKGGPTLLEAFARLRARVPGATLEIVGCEPRLSAEEQARGGIIWHAYVPRDLLLREILPQWDVFAYPTRFDGQPLVLLEAMAAGLAVVTSDYEAMPEMVDGGRAGIVCGVGDVEGLAAAMERLLLPEENHRYRAAARAWFESKYSATAVRPRLKASYDAAIESYSRRSASGV